MVKSRRAVFEAGPVSFSFLIVVSVLHFIKFYFFSKLHLVSVLDFRPLVFVLKSSSDWLQLTTFLMIDIETFQLYRRRVGNVRAVTETKRFSLAALDVCKLSTRFL